jgi:hypothetical protein
MQNRGSPDDGPLEIGRFGYRRQIQDSTKLEKAAYYGQPLFAYLQTKGLTKQWMVEKIIMKYFRVLYTIS